MNNMYKSKGIFLGLIFSFCLLSIQAQSNKKAGRNDGRREREYYIY